MNKKTLRNRLTRLEKRNLRKNAEKERIHIYPLTTGIPEHEDDGHVHIFLPDNSRGNPLLQENTKHDN